MRAHRHAAEGRRGDSYEEFSASEGEKPGLERPDDSKPTFVQPQVSTLGRLHPCVVCYAALSLHAAMSIVISIVLFDFASVLPP